MSFIKRLSIGKRAVIFSVFSNIEGLYDGIAFSPLYFHNLLWIKSIK